MNFKLLTVLIILLLTFITACSNEQATSTDESKKGIEEKSKRTDEGEKEEIKINNGDIGYIIQVNEGDGNRPPSIWIIPGIEQKDVSGKTEDELKTLYKFKGMIYYTDKIDNKIRNQLQIGTKVKVVIGDTIQLSMPGRADALKVEILES